MLYGWPVTFRFESMDPDIGMSLCLGKKLSMVFSLLFEEDEIGVFMVSRLESIIDCGL